MYFVVASLFLIASVNSTPLCGFPQDLLGSFYECDTCGGGGDYDFVRESRSAAVTEKPKVKEAVKLEDDSKKNIAIPQISASYIMGYQAIPMDPTGFYSLAGVQKQLGVNDKDQKDTKDEEYEKAQDALLQEKQKQITLMIQEQQRQMMMMLQQQQEEQWRQYLMELQAFQPDTLEKSTPKMENKESTTLKDAKASETTSKP